MAGELLASITAEIDARIDELRPVLAEYERLLSAADALGLSDAASAPTTRTARVKPASSPKTNGPKAAKPAAQETSPPSPRLRASGPRGSAAGTIGRARSSTPKAPRADGSKPARAVRGAAQQAIRAALEHGSHTVGELTVVTAMSGQNIRENLRRMLSSGAVTRAKREGKAAYELAVRAES
ncbi:MAG TPA: hypothetical protein VGN25_00570 [Solirubrobacteraceae bacterium]|jgi:hypothetical protein|nr:hypothetical protein [Solirubrobacteraceae bacterium]